MEAILNAAVERPALTHDDLLSVYYDALTPPDLWRVGTEAEKFGVLTDTRAPVPFDGPRSVAAVLQALSDMYGWFPEREYDGGPVISLKRGQASITLEPGGQLELSGAPFTSIHDTAAELSQHIDELNDVSRALGIVWLGLGFQPFARQDELPWVPKLRYGVMREYLPTRGSMGLDMMRRTSTVQANLDYASEADAIEKLRVSLALGPIITAMFANSPMLEGKLSGDRTRRARVWLNTDPDRTGLLRFAWEADMSFERYVEWALDVPMFMVKRGGRVVRNTGQTFRDFMRRGFEGTVATLDDFRTHIGSLFPEARLKSTLELRGADSVPGPLVAALPALAKGLLYDDRARAGAVELASRLSFDEVEAVRPQIAQSGLGARLGDKLVLQWAQDLFDLASSGLERLAVVNREGHDERLYLAALGQLLEHGQCPADQLIERIESGEDPAEAVLRHATL